MNAYCPDCETELDQNSGICPACRWDPVLAAAQQQQAQAKEPEISLSQRYRGTEYDLRAQMVASQDAPVSRGRAFVIVGLAAGAGLYAIAMGVLGVF